MMHTCQTSMLVSVSSASSFQCLRGMRNGTFISMSPSASTGMPRRIDVVWNVSGGKPVTPVFITGQLNPHAMVRRTRVTNCFAVSRCMGPHCARALECRLMTFLQQLQDAQQRNGSMLCVGLDPDPQRFPGAYKGDASRIYDFCARIVDATADLAIAFKPQIAYFAAHGAERQLEQLMAHLRSDAPHVPVILDAKRGDIGSTAEQYAKEAFERYGADAVTLSPFMGFDSIEPYLKYEGKGAFLLCRTSNAGGDDLQSQKLASVDGQPLLYEHIAKLAQGPWNTNGQLGLVVGATYPAEIERVRALAPKVPLLIPGVGAQGNDAVASVKAGWRCVAPIVVFSSRSILFASSGDDFTQAARTKTQHTRDML